MIWMNKWMDGLGNRDVAGCEYQMPNNRKPKEFGGRSDQPTKLGT